MQFSPAARSVSSMAFGGGPARIFEYRGTHEIVACPSYRPVWLSSRSALISGRRHGCREVGTAMADRGCKGMTSTEISEPLFVSRRTVDNQLNRVYAKLGVSGRSELAGALGEG